MGLTVFFFEEACLPERVSGSPLGTAEPGGSPPKLNRFFQLWERAAPATGRGRGRDSRWVGPRSIPRRPSRAAPRSAARGRRENAPPVEKTRFYFAICLVHIIYVYCCRCVSLKYISGTASTCSIWERKANTK